MAHVEPLYQEVQSISYKILFISIKASIFQELGDYQEGEKVIQKFSPLLEKETHIPLRLEASIVAAKILMDVGKREESFKKAKKSYEVAETYYMSSKNEICATALMIMARYYQSMRNLEKAQKTIEQSLSIYIMRHYLILISQYFGTGSLHITEILKHLDKEGLNLP